MRHNESLKALMAVAGFALATIIGAAPASAGTKHHSEHKRVETVREERHVEATPCKDEDDDDGGGFLGIGAHRRKREKCREPRLCHAARWTNNCRASLHDDDDDDGK